MSLYTKYRPRDWDSVIAQDYISKILRNSLQKDRVSHAYLFHGSRGTGKTTSARILAKGVNCLNLENGNPCHVCTNCQAFDSGTMLDCIEIDGASNNGVENIRELIEKARFEPNQGKYKVYIIDEVHMLSTGAFNALLKTLEEPPIHVKFILATTEIEKVPETIRSRTLRFDFKKFRSEDIIARLQYVCEAEGIRADTEALKLITRVARGGMRDALTLLEQNIIDQEVSTEYVRHALSLIDETFLDEIITTLRTQDTEKILSLIDSLRENHVDARGLLEEILYRLRDRMRQHINDTAEYRDYEALTQLILEGHSKIKLIPDGILLIEITFMKIVKRGDTPIGISGQKENMPPQEHQTVPKKTSTQNLGEKKSEKEESTHLSPVEQVRRDYEKQKQEKQGIGITLPEKDKNIAEEIGGTSEEVFSFPILIHHFRETAPGIATDLKLARFQREDQKLILIFSKSWNHNRVNTPKVKNHIAEALQTLFGDKGWTVDCRLEESKVDINLDEIF